MSQKPLGEFEHQVLLAILRLGEESYSAPIVLELEERSGREVSQAAVFVVLGRLEDKGLLSSRLEEAAANGGARTRRYFRLEREGLARLRESRHVMQRLWEGFEEVLEEGS